MIGFKHAIIASSSEPCARVWNISVPDDIEVRISYEPREVTISLSRIAPMGRDLCMKQTKRRRPTLLAPCWVGNTA